MIIKTTHQDFYVDSNKLADVCLEKAKKYNDAKIKLPDGTTVDLSGKSLARTALRQLVTILILPMLQGLAVTLKVTLRPKIKHEDPIMYCIESYIEILKVVSKDLILVADDKPFVEDLRIIENLSTPVQITEIIGVVD